MSATVTAGFAASGLINTSNSAGLQGLFVGERARHIELAAAELNETAYGSERALRAARREFEQLLDATDDGTPV
jgi:hypothetical protein